MDLRTYQSTLIEVLQGGPSAELQHQLAVTDPVSQSESATRMAVYQNNYAHSLTEALKATFPVMLRLIGDGLFSTVAIKYVKLNPPVSASLLNYGESFIDFLAKQPACKDLHYLEDVGHIEWLYLQCFHGDNIDCINMNHLLEEDENALPSVSFDWHPNCYLLSSDYPALTIWESNLDDEVTELDLSDVEPTRLLMYRDQALNVVPMQLHPIAYLFCDELQHGKTIASAWDNLQGQLDDPLPEEELYQLLAFLLQLPIFTGLTINRG